MFDKERFVQDCRDALREKDAQGAVQQLVARAVSDPAGVIQTLGEPSRSGVETIYRANDLTILNLCWGPRMDFKPHDHRIWAVIGLYSGREDNTFFRRKPEGGLTRHGTKELNAKDTARLGAEVIHAVVNPLDQITAAIHVYGGDFFATRRSEWNPQTLVEQPYNLEDTLRAFEEANQRLAVASAR